MRFDEIENIWTMDLSELSNADRGRVYFERAKQVVREALSDPAKRLQAVDGRRFRRSYLVEKIGCQPAVTTQNPKIKRLLVETDEQLASELLLPFLVLSGLLEEESEEFASMAADQDLVCDMAQQLPQVLTELYLLYQAPEEKPAFGKSAGGAQRKVKKSSGKR